MGFFSKLFGGKKKGSGIVSGKNPGRGWVEANKFNKARKGVAGGYGAWTFKNIIDAHSGAEEIVEEFQLDQEDAEFGNCWQIAYKEAYQEASIEAAMMSAFGFEEDPEDYIDWEEVEENAHDYAIDLAESWINGDVWIPHDVIEWAYYDVSDHNM